VADLRTVTSGEACPRCDSGTLEVYKAMEIGHIFKLGTKYSEVNGRDGADRRSKPVPIIMGSYGIGVERIISAAVEQNYERRRNYLAQGDCPVRCGGNRHQHER